ncbi:hypothetical protein D3C80_2216440 [compost metagenome]
MVPAQRPLNSLSAKTSFCIALPCAISALALPEVSMFEPMLTDAAAKKLLAADSSVYGSCMPPIS